MSQKNNSYQINRLFYITHISNIPSILSKGIFSHEEIESQSLNPEKIYNPGIVNFRKEKTIATGKKLWYYANLFIQPRNPMLFRLMRNSVLYDKIAILEISPEILSIEGLVIADGLAARSETNFYDLEKGLKALWKQRKVFDLEYWTYGDSSSRQIMSEVLVPRHVPYQSIRSIYVPTQDVLMQVKNLVKDERIPIIREPNMFFLPTWRNRITKNLSLADSDMFFSKMQTITISVNTVGIMGKGLASRAKYQFPDLYVKYQEVCRTKQLAMGKPYLYKREGPVPQDFFDDGLSTSEDWRQLWFLLFPTKNHWREDSDIDGIEKGLNWLSNSYKKLGIRSIALPALGCGLGNLSWDLVGPLMCKYLANLEIPSVIYLPRENVLPPETLTRNFLLKL